MQAIVGMHQLSRHQEDTLAQGLQRGFHACAGKAKKDRAFPVSNLTTMIFPPEIQVQFM